MYTPRKVNSTMAQPNTPVSQAAPHEDAFHKYVDDPQYFEKNARSLTLYWEKEDIELVIPSNGLKAIPLGSGRYAGNGVHYSPLPTSNPTQLLYHVHPGQFKTLVMNYGRGGELEKGFHIIIDNAKRTPDGLLVVIKPKIDGLGWDFARNRKGELVSGSDVCEALGFPTTTREFPPPSGSKLGKLLRRPMTKLTGKDRSMSSRGTG